MRARLLGASVCPFALNLALASVGFALDDGQWSSVSPPFPPPARVLHTAIYDPLRERMVVFGGWSGGPRYNDVWVLSLGATPAWSQVVPSGTPPIARDAHTAIYDPLRDRMVVFGGGANNQEHNDVWALTFSGGPAWSEILPTGVPPAGRHGHTAIYDPVRDRMVVFGGGDPFHNDVWALTLSGTPTWTQLLPVGTPPIVRINHTAIYDPVRDRMVVFGGWNGGDAYNDVWALSFAGTPTWSQLAPAGATLAPRPYHSAIYDPLRDRMVVFGGGIGFLNDVWALSFPGLSWSALTPLGIGPNGRHAHTAIYDPALDRMILFAGYDGDNVHNDLWILTWGAWGAPVFMDSGHATGAAWVDIDGDADLDLHVLRTQGENDIVYENQGAGVFVTNPSLSPLDDPGDGQGMDWGDYDNDGDLDLYLVNASSANKLIRNDGGGSFADVTPPPLDYGCCDEGATWIDYDRDGLLDLYLTTGSGEPNHLYQNLGGTTFVETTPAALAITSQCASSTWGDYDGDGDSDVFVSVADGADRLVRNDGGGAFEDVTVAPLDDAGTAQGAAWIDYDNDADLDLYLCNSGQPNRLFRNDGVSFVNVAQGQLADPNLGRSGTWADFDNDGDLDVALTNFGQTSRLLQNQGANLFSLMAMIGDTAHAVGAAWGDCDEDGDQDLFVANSNSADRFVRNQLSPRHRLDVTLQGTTSNRSGIGARISVFDLTSGVGQMREHGSNHGLWSCNSPVEHFGLGTATRADIVTVRWPSGSIQVFQDVPADHHITIVEGGGIVGVEAAIVAPSPLQVSITPNPFRDHVVISWSAPSSRVAQLDIFDVMGRHVRSYLGKEGAGSIMWRGEDESGRLLGTGVYFYRLQSGDERRTGKLLRLR